MQTSRLTAILMSLSCVLILEGVVSLAETTKIKQSGCHNNNVMLGCTYYADGVKKSGIKSADLQWRVKDNVANKWRRIATIRSGKQRLFPYPHLDNRTTLHNNGSLEIHSLRPDDATHFQCRVSQTGKRDTHFIELSVLCNGKVTVTTQEVCEEDDVLLDCQSKHRTNPVYLKKVVWHKKGISSWSMVLTSDKHNSTSDGTTLHQNGSLLLPAGTRQESEMKYKCDVFKNVVSPRERHIVIVKNVRCRPEKRAVATIKTTMGRVAMTTATPVQGTTVAMDTTPASVQQTTTTRQMTTPGANVCGESLTAVTGSFQSPNFPSAYPANAHCKWAISVPQNYAAIDITLEQMNLEDEDKCQNDYISIHDELGNQVGCRLCGSKHKPIRIQVRGRVAVVEFNSDSTVHKTGFKLTYQATKTVEESSS